MKSNTLILVITAAIFAGGVFIWDRQQSSQPQTEAEETGTAIFTFSEDEVQRLTITTPVQTLTFKKVTGSSTWAMEAPEAGPADEAALLFLINLLATAQSQRTLDISPAQQQDFGLDQPTTVEVFLSNQQTHTLILGGKDYEGGAVYARVDPVKTETQSWAVELVPTSFLDAVSRPVAEWKAQPQSNDS
ncbi:hypothetical protein C1752_01473 [Acaryochloris thomasi RCC1774]|uniref:DUF4340 domain-containing protein n=1 Tax=Acaryochloris thomasi RCC1774 TaxID=1764569 RepID=A0A2W1JV26_9CYAN|nr:DUF4340 domain-containing protein [Acaryochloris thomasi]PZD74332.1 hypothetical protein C1752_01473 [Acaryochloris thomasi RCC1774]